MSNWIKRKETAVVNVGAVPIGGGNPIAVQSMTNTNTLDVVSTVNQINELQAAGADIVRVSVPGFDEAKAFKEIKSIVTIPLVADIHFDYKIAIEVADSADCLRINPGLKTTTFFSGTGTSSPVRGLRPILPRRVLTLNTPKFLSSTVSLLSRLSAIASSVF